MLKKQFVGLETIYWEYQYGSSESYVYEQGGAKQINPIDKKSVIHYMYTYEIKYEISTVL